MSGPAVFPFSGIDCRAFFVVRARLMPPTDDDNSQPQKPPGWGKRPRSSDSSEYPGPQGQQGMAPNWPQYPSQTGINIQPAAGPWDVAKQFLINLFQYRFIEVLLMVMFTILVAIIVGYIGWVDPSRRKEEAEERKAIAVEYSRSHEKAASDLKEAVNSVVLDSQAARVEHTRQLNELSKMQSADRDRYVQTMEKMLKLSAPQGNP